MRSENAADTLRKGLGRLSDDSGAAMVEFAIVAPFLLLLLFGIVEFGRAWNVRQTVTDVAREGARIAAVNRGLVTPAEALQDSVTRTIRRSAERARLEQTRLFVTFDNTAPVGGTAGDPVRINVRYDYNPLFGTWVLPQQVLQIRSSAVMRNE